MNCFSLVCVTSVCAFVVSFAGCSSDSGSSVSVPSGSDASVDSASDAVSDTMTPEAKADILEPEDSGSDVDDAGNDASQPDTQPLDSTSPDGDIEDSTSPDSPADSPEPWPTCDAKPDSVPARTLPEVWALNPATPQAVWLSDLYVSAISYGKCSAGFACQVFLQDALTYGSFADGAHHGIKLFASKNTAEHFSHLAVGDKVNVQAFAERTTLLPGQNELQLTVRTGFAGCAKRIGTGDLVPIEGVELTDLTVAAYETTHGPLLVKVKEVSGRPGNPKETFALWKTGGPYTDGGLESVVNASPYFISAGTFTGLPSDGETRVNFAWISGVFGLFIPVSDAGQAKYLMLYPRRNDELVKVP